MFYDFAINVETGRDKDDPVEQELGLTHGIVHRIEVQFPIGTRALVHCQIYHREHQVWPTNIDGSFASDGYVIPIDEHYELLEPPYNLKVKLWSDDDTYGHVITVRVGVLPVQVLTPFAGLGGALRKFLKMVGIGK